MLGDGVLETEQRRIVIQHRVTSWGVALLVKEASKFVVFLDDEPLFD